ncbi:MAG: hypothetical protein U1F76_06030 [Candidatus Competibacteraceae bacterium]
MIDRFEQQWRAQQNKQNSPASATKPAPTEPGKPAPTATPVAPTPNANTPPPASPREAKEPKRLLAGWLPEQAGLDKTLPGVQAPNLTLPLSASKALAAGGSPPAIRTISQTAAAAAGAGDLAGKDRQPGRVRMAYLFRATRYMMARSAYP